MPNNNPLGRFAGSWPEDHTQELTRLAGGKISYRDIAAALNEKFGTAYTKNSVIGKAQRIGISKEAAPSIPGNHKPKVDRKIPYKVREPRVRIDTVRIVPANGNSNAMRVIRSVSFELTQLRCVEIVPRHLSLMDLEPGDCRFPYGDDAITYCGHPKQDGSSYCTPHHALCYEKPRIPVYRFVGRAA